MSQQSPRPGAADQRPGMQRQRGPTPPDAGRGVPAAITFSLSLAVVLGLVALVSYQHFARGSEPPTIEVTPQLDAVRRAGDAYYVPVEIKNRGGRTAADLRVQVTLRPSQGEQQEPAELLILFLPAGGTAHGTVVFHEQPSQERLRATVVSFLHP